MTVASLNPGNAEINVQQLPHSCLQRAPLPVRVATTVLHVATDYACQLLEGEYKYHTYIALRLVTLTKNWPDHFLNVTAHHILNFTFWRQNYFFNFSTLCI